MSDEKFFSQVKGSLESYAPEVPQEVYSKMRRKLWWSGFTKLSAARFNMWYLILLVGLGGGLMAYSNTCDAPASTVKMEPLTPVVNPSTTTNLVSAPAIIEVAAPIEESIAMVEKKETVAQPKAEKKSTSKKEVAIPVATSEKEVVVAPTIAETASEDETADTVKEDAPKKKHKKLTLDIFTSDKTEDTKEDEN